jgi:TFIIF-interacting CTD phosphatase-like protein
VYTAGNKDYADAVLNEINRKKVIQKRFYRECCKKKNGTFYKDLKHLKKITKNNTEMILVDDNTVSIGHNYPFAIKIK